MRLPVGLVAAAASCDSVQPMHASAHCGGIDGFTPDTWGRTMLWELNQDVPRKAYILVPAMALFDNTCAAPAVQALS